MKRTLAQISNRSARYPYEGKANNAKFCSKLLQYMLCNNKKSYSNVNKTCIIC